MNTRRLLKPLIAFALATAVAAPLQASAHHASASTATTAEWIGSWTASPQSSWGPDFLLPTNTPAQLSNQTVRQVASVSLGGHRVRISLSNAYGKAPLVIGAAHIARAEGNSRIAAGSDRPLTFGGKASVTIMPGASVRSDPAALEVSPLSEVAVSLYLPQVTSTSTFHWEARQTAYIARGNQVGAAALPGGTRLPTRVFVTDIQVDAPADARAVVALGDSITDGHGATADRNQRWPDFLARRLAKDHVAVLNAGISGGRLLSDGMGVSGLARFERDVLGQPKVRSVIVLLGINDISWPGSAFEPAAAPITARQVIAGYRQLIARAHAHSIRIVGATLTPFEGALEGTPITGYYNTDKEQVRQAVNRWIRSSGEFDAVVDFDAATRDPQHHARFLALCDSGDHLHPGDAGDRVMADAIDENTLFGTR